MIDWKDCMQVDRLEYVWVAYSKDYPFLPVAIASSAAELARLVGVSTNAVESLWSKFVHGKVRRTRYARVLIEEEA